MNIKKTITIIGLFVVVVTFVGAASAFKDAPVKAINYYNFEYQSGDASDPSNWAYTTSSTGCSGAGMSCKIRLSEDYVNSATSPAQIDASALSGGLLPTVSGIGSNKVPDPSSGVYDQIFNQTP